MPYQNDMGTLAQVVSPAFAAGQAGMQEGLANEEQQTKNQILQGQATAEIARPGLQNLFTQAQTASQQGIAQQEQAKGLTAQQNQPLVSAATGAGAQTEFTMQHAKQLQTLGSIAGNLAGQMDSVSPMERPYRMQQILQQSGIDPQSVGGLASGDPDTLRQFATNAIQYSQDFMTKQMEAQTHATAAENVAQIGGASHLAATKELVGGRVQAEQIKADVKRDLAPPTALIGSLSAKLAKGTITPDEKATLDYMNKVANYGKTAPFQSTITGTNTQGTEPAIPTTGGGGQQPQQAPQVIPPTPAGQQAITQKFQTYEPDKYDYVQAVNPATGQLDIGRIPKQGK